MTRIMNFGPHPTASDVSPAGPVSPEQVSRQLGRMLAAETFERADRVSRFLEFVVEQALQGKADELKQYVIALEVFDKPPSFDPCTDPIVRVQARRLREKILEYYGGEGRLDPVWIGLAPIGYQPRFELRSPPAEGVMAAATTASERYDGRPRIELGPTPASRAIAVLPFVDLSPGDDNRLFCSALTDQIITNLARQRDLRVASSGTTAQYHGRWVDVRQIGEELQVGMVLEGSAQRCGDRVRVRVQMASAASRMDVWGGIYDRNWRNLLDLQDEIAAEIVAGLRLELFGAPCAG